MRLAHQRGRAGQGVVWLGMAWRGMGRLRQFQQEKRSMKHMKVKITGVSPLLMHNGRLADPLNEATKKLKALTSKKQKVDADHEAIARVEWEGGLYYDEEIGPYIPAENIDGAIKAAAKLQKLGKHFGQAVMVVEDRTPLKYKGPRDLDGLFKAGFKDTRSVRNQMARVMRCRPRFDGWSCEFTLAYDEEIVNEESIRRAVIASGKRSGLGDWRPEKGGRYGKFAAEVV
jgi:hypothetical protein